MSWEQLTAMAREGRREAQRERMLPPVDCPIDGTRLEIRGDGVRNCPLGNWRWPSQGAGR